MNPPERSADCPARVPPPARVASWCANEIETSSASPALGPGTPTHTWHLGAPARAMSRRERAPEPAEAAAAVGDVRSDQAPKAAVTHANALSGPTSPAMATT